MFHLLVSYNGWDEAGVTLPTSRIYIKWREDPDEVALTDGKLDINKVNRLPAVLMTEIGGDEPQTARIAYIHQVSNNGRETSVQYSTMQACPGVAVRYGSF